MLLLGHTTRKRPRIYCKQCHLQMRRLVYVSTLMVHRDICCSIIQSKRALTRLFRWKYVERSFGVEHLASYLSVINCIGLMDAFRVQARPPRAHPIPLSEGRAGVSIAQ